MLTCFVGTGISEAEGIHNCNAQNTGCPTRYQTWHVSNNFTVSQQLGARQTHTTDTFLFITHTTNVPLFKFRWNIFTGVRIINEMPGSVASGTSCIILQRNNVTVYFKYSEDKSLERLLKI